MVNRVYGVPKDYHWGDTEQIDSFLGNRPDGSKLAELWFGAHQTAPSPTDCGKNLKDLIDGDRVFALGESGGELPFLLKLLSANQALSIQAHPSRELAVKGFENEDAQNIPLDAPNRTFKDKNHKPELIYALSTFDLMYGFRAMSATRELLSQLGALQFLKFLALEDSGCGIADAGLEKICLRLLRLDHACALIEDTVDCIVQSAPRDPEAARVRDNIMGIADAYPGDPGILVALLMNHLRLQPGEAIATKDGVLHAYLNGFGVEVMANSDNVLRGGLTRKHIDLDGLKQAVAWVPNTPEPFQMVEKGLVAISDDVYSGVFDCGVIWTGGAPALIMSLGEGVRVGEESLSQGEVVWLPAGTGDVRVRTSQSPYFLVCGSANVSFECSD